MRFFGYGTDANNAARDLQSPRTPYGPLPRARAGLSALPSRRPRAAQGTGTARWAHLSDILDSAVSRRRQSETKAGRQEPFQAEIFGMERLESFAHTLAESDTTGAGLRAGQPLRARFKSN